MCGDAAIYVDPHRAESITEAMKLVLLPDARNQLIARHSKNAPASFFTVNHAISELDRALLKLVPVRSTFGS
jgi:hypothetical protein